MASTNGNGAGGRGSPRTVAVVLCAPTSGEAPRTLLDALRRRGVEPLVTQDVFSASLLVARASEHVSPALIVIDPGAHRAGPIEDLLRSVRRRFPGVAIWRYEASARPPLRAFSDVREGALSGTNGTSPVVVRSGAMRAQGAPAQPVLRLTGEPKPSAQSSESAATARDAEERSETPSALLTEEELAMLLSDDLDGPLKDPLDDPLEDRSR